MDRKRTETIDSKLKAAWFAVSRMYNAEAVFHEGTIAMSYFLLNIDARDGSFASDIAPKLGTESTSLSRIIQSLEEKKLIRRVQEKGDKRKIKIILTTRGRQKKELAKNSVRNFNRKVEQLIGTEALLFFLKILDRIIRIAEERNKELKVRI